MLHEIYHFYQQHFGSPVTFKRDLVGLAMKVAGLAKLWDSDAHVRSRCREHRRMNLHPDTQKWCEPTRANCVTNAMILLPCLDRLGKTKGYKLPHLEQLHVEIESLFEKMRMPIDEKMIYRNSTEIKRCWALWRDVPTERRWRRTAMFPKDPQHS